MCRPFVEPNSVDHDDGVEGMTVARTHVLRPKRQYTGGVPGHVQAQIHKDKATCSILVRPYEALFSRRLVRLLVLLLHGALCCSPADRHCKCRHVACSG